MTSPRLRQTASRRRFLGLAGATAGAALLAACGAGPEAERVPVVELTAEPTGVLPPSDVLAPPVPSATSLPTVQRPELPLGDRRQLQRLALPETPWETPITINRSGRHGPSVMILGGVHGNEPGGWAAAGVIADWMPDRGVTVVIPRANVVATRIIERTLPELGDLNRFYPGEPPESPNAFPMQRMAYSIIELAREFEVGLLLDLHESWGFFNERTQDGTAFLGQTVTNGAAVNQSDRIEAIVTEVNELVSDREQLVMRDRNRNRFAAGTVHSTNFDPSWPRGGTSSLGIGQFVPSLVPVLIEMGQQNQPESRRSELHQLFVRTALQREGLFAG